MPKLTLLVLAAGMGSRYGGLKQLDPMGPSGETLLDYSVFDALRAGFERVVFIIRRDIETEFRQKVGLRYQGKIAVDYVFQQLDFLPEVFQSRRQKETVGNGARGLVRARGGERTFSAINADDFYGRETYQVVGRFLGSSSPQAPHLRWLATGWITRSPSMARLPAGMPGGCPRTTDNDHGMYGNRACGRRDSTTRTGRERKEVSWGRACFHEFLGPDACRVPID